jgi:hypothetical protein
MIRIRKNILCAVHCTVYNVVHCTSTVPCYFRVLQGMMQVKIKVTVSQDAFFIFIHIFKYLGLTERHGCFFCIFLDISCD